MQKDEQGEDWRAEVGDKTDEGLRVDLARAREPGRGREAGTPEEIPARGWNDILWRVFWAIPENRILSTWDGVAFFALLATFPALATIVSLYGLFADASTISSHLTLLTDILPGGALELISRHIVVIARRHARRGFRAQFRHRAVERQCRHRGSF